MTDIKVTGCHECPFKDENDMAIGYSCLAWAAIYNGDAGLIRESKFGHPITPAWCPLKKEPVTVIMETK